jgi:hypothetical protein
MNRKTVSITIEEYAELEHLRNYKKINELDFLVRQNFKLEYPEKFLKKKISEFIKYDNSIETKCCDCNELLLIKDNQRCKSSINGNELCNKECCEKCLIYNIYDLIPIKKKILKYVKEQIKCCKDCYNKNNNKCDKCDLKINKIQIQKCHICKQKFCYECEIFSKGEKRISSSFSTREIDIHSYGHQTVRRKYPFITYTRRKICFECNEKQIKEISGIIQEEIFHKCEKDDGNDILKHLISKNQK